MFVLLLKQRENSFLFSYCILDIKYVIFIPLFLVDPDAPSRAEPSKREVLHWLVVNIPGNEIKKGEVCKSL